jgi:uncharacterized protein (DUF111 family)
VSRSIAAVDIDGHTIRIKSSPGRIKAEFDDVARAARDSGIPLREVAARAEAAWQSQQVDEDTGAGSTGRGHDEDPTA